MEAMEVNIQGHKKIKMNAVDPILMKIMIMKLKMKKMVIMIMMMMKMMKMKMKAIKNNHRIIHMNHLMVMEMEIIMGIK
jgi:hypothetical protein